MDAEKHRIATDITHQTQLNLIALIKPGISVSELCVQGDKWLQERFGQVFAKYADMERGIAHPTCIMLNDGVAFFAPTAKDDCLLKDGDLVKM